MTHFIVSHNNDFRILLNLHKLCEVLLVLCLHMPSLTVILRVLIKTYEPVERLDKWKY